MPRWRVGRQPGRDSPIRSPAGNSTITTMTTIMTGTDTCAMTIVTITDRHLLSLCRRFAGQRRAWWLAAWMIVCLLLSQQIGWSHGIHHMTVAPVQVQVQAIDGAGQ